MKSKAEKAARAYSHWEDDETHPVEDWKTEVANDDTRQGYWTWVGNQRAIKAGAPNLWDEEHT